MKFRYYKSFYVYFEEYFKFTVLADQIELQNKEFVFFLHDALVCKIAKGLLQHIEYYPNLFGPETVILSKDELLEELS